MTNWKHPGNIVNSITFFNPPRQTTVADLHQRQHLQQTVVTSQQHVPHVSSPMVGTSIAGNVPNHIHNAVQAHPSSTIRPQQLSFPPFQIHYSTKDPQLTTTH